MGKTLKYIYSFTNLRIVIRKGGIGRTEQNRLGMENGGIVLCEKLNARNKERIPTPDPFHSYVDFHVSTALQLTHLKALNDVNSCIHLNFT